jgi:phosphomannomutase
LDVIETPQEIRTYIKTLPTLYFSKKAISCPNDEKEKVMKLIQSMVTELQPTEVNSLDGIRFEFSDSWLLIRPSGTEPIIRIICESESQSHLKTHEEEGMAMVKAAMEKV